MVWYKLNLSLHQKQNRRIMKNTDYNLKQFENAISSEGSLDAFLGLVNDLDLQLVEVSVSA